MTTILSVNRNGDVQVEETTSHGSLTYVAAIVCVSVKDDGQGSIARVDVAVDCGVASPNRARDPAEGVTILSVRAAYYTTTPA